MKCDSALSFLEAYCCHIAGHGGTAYAAYSLPGLGQLSKTPRVFVVKYWPSLAFYHALPLMLLVAFACPWSFVLSYWVWMVVTSLVERTPRRVGCFVERGAVGTPNTTRGCGFVVQLGGLPSMAPSQYSNKGYCLWFWGLE